ncbi:MAG: hypothetical protein CMH63_02925 [Nanoarchaeota archaeon]|jgi:uncharacterized membrane protein|nr:hypothetical protein [Nanoarchaeota archaeon]|tara:strand:- start:7772 stop:8287 length:516 start_codon:yes stop_codon:yes gene_type:complete
MDNKKLGIILIINCIIFSFIIYTFNNSLNAQTETACSCTEMLDAGFCPHQKSTHWQTYLGIILISAITALGFYLIFFEKSQKHILSTLEKQKQLTSEEEKFNILLKGLNQEEQKIIKAVKEQGGITQQTLRFRTDLHKSKLSILLEQLEKKDLIYRKEKGKTKQVFLKITF